MFDVMGDSPSQKNMSQNDRENYNYREMLLNLKGVTWLSSSSDEPLQYGRAPIDLFINDLTQPRGDSITKKSIEERGASMKECGQLQNIAVQPYDQELKKFPIVFGETRWRGAPLAELTHLNFTVYEKKKDETEEQYRARVLLMQLTENMQRSNVPALKQAAAIVKLINDTTVPSDVEMGVNEYVAKQLGKSKNYVSNAVTTNNANQNVVAFLKKINSSDLQVSSALARAYKKNEGKTKELMDSYLEAYEKGITTPRLREKAKLIKATGAKGKNKKNNTGVRKQANRASTPEDVEIKEVNGNKILFLIKGDIEFKYILSEKVEEKLNEELLKNRKKN